VINNARIRAIKALVARAGLSVDGEAVVGGSHIKLPLRNAQGVRRNFICAATPGDWRADRNNLAWLRRFAREQPH